MKKEKFKLGNKSFVFMYINTSDLFIVTEINEQMHFLIPDNLQDDFYKMGFDEFFYNNSACLGEL